MEYSFKTNEYLQNLHNTHETEYLKNLRQCAIENHVPIVSSEVASLLAVIVSMSQPKNILEVGTAIGYSASLMLNVAPNSVITTIDHNAKSLDRAREHFENQGYLDRVKIINGDAKEIIQKLNDKYDLIFLDGPKGHYVFFLPYLIDMLNSGGVIFSDNVLYRGMVSGECEVPRRQRTIFNRLNGYLKAISDDERLNSTILPIGDGVSISVKK